MYWDSWYEMWSYMQGFEVVLLLKRKATPGNRCGHIQDLSINIEISFLELANCGWNEYIHLHLAGWLISVH